MHADGADLVDRIVAGDQIANDGEGGVTAGKVGNGIQIAIENAIGDRVDRLASP